MDEREMLEKIAQSAQNLKVPDTLKPEQVQKQLQIQKQQKQKRKKYRFLSAAACLCLCFGMGSMVYQNHISSQAQAGLKADAAKTQAGQEENGTDAQAGQEESAIDAQAGQGESGSDVQAGQNQAEHAQTAEAADNETAADGLQKEQNNNSVKPLKKIGRMYTLASGYGDVYDVLKNTQRFWEERKEYSTGTREELSADMSAASPNQSVKDNAKTESAVEFSSTNLQTAGVDESDVIKTDGSYLYAVHKNHQRIQILDIRNGMPVKAAVIEPDLNEDTDRICEMYVADGRLTIIAQCEKTELKNKDASSENGEEEPVSADQDTASRKDALRKLAGDDMQYINTQAVTKAVSYDISNPKSPVLQDEASQDGWYQTSRKIGNRLYLFTNKSLRIADNLTRKYAVKEEALDLWVPKVNGRPVSADCIYLPKEGDEGMIMSSFDLADHHKVLDTKMLLNNSAQLYVTKSSVYLYYSDYSNETVKTRIARFSLESDGTIRAKAAKTIKGLIQDTFAIYEREGYLQVLTSVTSSEPWENRVYVLDENLETAGKLTGLAKGEEIYSARFAGNIGYFVTYRNTDPLFTVDFSDPGNPKVIGELKVTGFSDYLHFWSDDRLLGIGLEMNPESGNTEGVKLSMFDISNPAKVTEEAKIVIKGAQQSNAMRDYKSVLVDLNKNIIALITESYHDSYKENFHIFSYKNGKFVTRAERPLAAGNKDYEESTWRSLFAGDTLYLASEKKVIAFDMKQQWNEIGKLVY